MNSVLKKFRAEAGLARAVPGTRLTRRTRRPFRRARGGSACMEVRPMVDGQPTAVGGYLTVGDGGLMAVPRAVGSPSTDQSLTQSSGAIHVEALSSCPRMSAFHRCAWVSPINSAAAPQGGGGAPGVKG